MTLAQKTARAAHRQALRNMRNAEHGFRNMARKALRDAATAVLVADNEAKKRRAA